jgi:hypothetical protein
MRQRLCCFFENALLRVDVMMMCSPPWAPFMVLFRISCHFLASLCCVFEKSAFLTRFSFRSVHFEILRSIEALTSRLEWKWLVCMVLSVRRPLSYCGKDDSRKCSLTNLNDRN